MYLLRRLAVLLPLGLSVLDLTLAQPAAAQDQAEDAAIGTLHLILFGADDRALSDTEVDLAGARHTTNAQGALRLSAEAGTHALLLRVPRALVPEAPPGAGPWQINLPDVPVVAGESTELILTLRADGSIDTLDLQAPTADAADAASQETATDAAAPTHTVRGVVLGAEGGAPVAGARIYVRGAPVDAESGSDGTFTLALPEGSYSLSVIHPKFSTQSVPQFTLGASEPVELRVELSPASAELDELVVTAPHIEGGVAAVSAERRELSSVADVLGAEQMSKAGDSSAAAALTRVTGLTIVGGKFIYVRGMGDRYSSTLLNGLRIPSPEPDVRVVPLDLFPAGLLESVLVQKGYSADLPGDFGGGVVALRTKGYPERLVISASVGIGGNTATTFREGPSYQSGKTDWLGFDDGGRALPEAVARIPKLERGSPLSPGGLSEAELNELGRSFDNRWELEDKFLLPDGDASLVVGNSFKLGPHARGGFSAAGLYSHEWRLIRDAQRGLYNLQGARQRETSADSLDREILLGGMFDAGVTWRKDQELRLTTMVLRQTTDETFHITDGWWGEVDSDFRQTRYAFVERQLFSQQVTGKHLLRPLHNLQMEWKYAFSLASRDEPNHLENLYWRSGDQYQLFTRSGSNLRFYSDLEDELHDARLDLTQPVPVWSSLEAKLKAGMAVFRQERAVNSRRFSVNATSTPVENLRMPPEEVLGPSLIGAPGGTTFSEGTLPADPYTGSVRGVAGYGALELPVAKWLELMGGARVEKFEIVADTVNSTAQIDTFDVFPTSSLTAHLTKSLQLRGSFAQTINRPDLRELVPSQFTDVQTGVTKRGNPDLKPASLRHYDARIEWYLTGDEGVSLGGFYKTFERPIELQLQGGATPTQTWSNAQGGQNFGLELDGRKRLGFLHERIDDLYVSGNLALIRSQVELAEGSIATNQKRPLAGQSPWVINLQIGYDGEQSGLTTTLLYNVSGPRIDSVGVMGLADVKEQPFHQLDFVLAKELDHGLRVSAKAKNILNGTRRFTQGDYVFASYRRGVDLSLDLTWNL